LSCPLHLGDKKTRWFSAGRLSLSEVITIIFLFHLNTYRYFILIRKELYGEDRREQLPTEASDTTSVSEELFSFEESIQPSESI
jgi:hypothetical protein